MHACTQVYVPPHPLVKHWLAVARNASTPTPIFRSAIAELGRILIYEAVREFLPTVDGTVDTPMGPADVTCVDPMRPVKVCLHPHALCRCVACLHSSCVLPHASQTTACSHRQA